MNAIAMSSYRMLGNIGYVIGPITLGALADGAGAESALLLAAAGMLFMGIAFARYAPETYSAR